MKLSSVHDISGAAATVSSVTGVTLWGMNLSELGAAISAAVAVLTFCVYLWTSVRRDKRAEELHKARLATKDFDGEPG